MAPILDGLLDPELDLSILFLTLQERTTHAILTQQALVHPSPEKTSLPLFLGNHLDARRPSTLYVPHIRLPWAQALTDVLLTRLNIRLIPPQTSTDAIVQAPSIVRTLLNHKPAQPSADWHQLVSSFYAPLSPSAVSHNERTLAHIRALYSPRFLYRLAVAARLAMVSALRSAFVRTPLHVLDSYLSLSVPSTLKRTRTRSAVITIIARPIPRSVAVSTLKSSAVPSVDSDGSVLLHNAVLKKVLLPVVADVLEKRYAVRVASATSNSLCLTRTNRLDGSLVSLANRGTALVNIRQKDYYHDMPTEKSCLIDNKQNKWTKKCKVSTISSCSPNDNEADVDRYLREAHGTTWTAVLEWATGEAMKAVVEAREKEWTRIKNAIEHTEQIRERLLEKAVSLEVAGAPLYKICAFTIVQKLDSSEIDCLENLECEYDSCLTYARRRMDSLRSISNCSAQPSAHLVATLALS